MGQDKGLFAALACAHENSGPHARVKDGVVLADEVNEPRLRLLPVPAPAVGVASELGPLHRGGDVAYGCVEPHVESFVLEARLGDGDAPEDVAGNGALLEAAPDHAEDGGLDRVAPVVLLSDPRPQAVGELGQVKVEVRRLTHLYGTARDLG